MSKGRDWNEECRGSRAGPAKTKKVEQRMDKNSGGKRRVRSGIEICRGSRAMPR